MRKLRVMILADTPMRAESLKGELRKSDMYEFCTPLVDTDVPGTIGDFSPTLIIVTSHISNQEKRDGLAGLLDEEKTIPIIYITEFSENRIVLQTDSIQSSGYVIKSLEHQLLKPVIDLVMIRHHLTRKFQKKEQILLKKTFNLRKRVKELHCFYGISKITEQWGKPVDEVLQEITDKIPPAMKNPEQTFACTVYRGRRYHTNNYVPTSFTLTKELRAGENLIGRIEIGFITGKEEEIKYPFQYEEIDLLNGIAAQLENYLERKSLEIKIERRNRELSYLSETAMIFSEISISDDIFKVITNQLSRLFPNSIIIIGEYCPKEHSIAFRAMDSADNRAELLNSLAEGIFKKIRIPEKCCNTDYRSLERLSGGLGELLNGLVNTEQRREIEGALLSEEVYRINICLEDHLLGCVVVLVQDSADLLEKEIFETLVRQAAGVLYRWKTDKKVESINNQLSEANEKLKATQTQMVHQEKLASVGRLASGVAHELNNPLGFISSNFGILKEYVRKLKKYIEFQDDLIRNMTSFAERSDGKKIEKAIEYRKKKNIGYILDDIDELLSESDEGLNRVAVIVNNLRSFSRIDDVSGITSVDFNETVQSVLSVTENQIREFADVETNLGKLPAVECCIKDINQVLLNLLLNASEALKTKGRHGGGKILIKTYYNKPHIYCEISDNGIGITSENIGKIFDPFFTTKEIGQGTGLGLSISYDIIVNKHGGKLTVESQEGSGTQFTLIIPERSVVLTPQEHSDTHL